MSKIAGGITVVTNVANTNLGGTIGFQVSGSSIDGTVKTHNGETITLNGTDIFVKDRVNCHITEADSNNATTHILVFHSVRSTV